MTYGDLHRQYPPKQVYLAGPMTGLSYEKARFGWRREFSNLLPSHIFCTSPLRGKEFLAEIKGELHGGDYPENALSTDAGILARDTNDVVTSDAMVACFLESGGKLSGGTFIEYGLAHLARKTVIAIGHPDDPNISHAMARRIAAYRVDTLEEGADILIHLLTPGI